jgi:hypothetical protein
MVERELVMRIGESLSLMRIVVLGYDTWGSSEHSLVAETSRTARGRFEKRP